jgi:hypothetical protein
MSATRRAVSETNILAMLDRQASTALPQRVLRSALAMPAVFWYGAAGVLVCGMVATLAWLAHDSGTPAVVDTALAGAITPGPARAAKVAAVLTPATDPDSVTASVTAHVPAPAPASASVPAPVPAQVSAPAPKAGATIVNVAPAAAAELAQASPAPAAGLPQRQQPGHIAPRELQREPQRLAAHAAMARTALPRATARSRRHPAPAKAAVPAVDTDVALISAIIRHAATRQETQEAACADRACGPRMPAKP